MSFKDNSETVKQTIAEKLPAALSAMGAEAVSMVQENMESGYGSPIRKTGALHDDVAFDVNKDRNVVEIGNRLCYSLFVHDGTRKMAARPYITDALLNNSAKKKLLEIAKKELF